MFILFAFCAIPLIWFIVAKYLFRSEITWLECVLSVLVSIAIVVGVWMLTRFDNASDTEIINGQVIGHFTETHQCNTYWSTSTSSGCRYYDTRSVKIGESCTRDSKGNQSCTPIYQTEYKHWWSWEKDWYIKHDQAWLGSNYLEIERVDRRGANTPAFYTEIKDHDPIALQHSYYNWVRAASESLFNTSKIQLLTEKYKDLIPDYPADIYNYTRINRVLTVNTTVSDLADWNWDLSMLLRELGPTRQMNAVIVIGKDLPSDYTQVLQAVWKGFKKNDAIVVLSVDNSGNLANVQIESWSKNELFDIELRDKLFQLEGKPLDRQFVITAIGEIGMKSFARYSMKEFAYLQNEVPISWKFYVLALLLIAASCVGLTYYNINNKFRSI